jgi:hypothetical protein
MNVMKETDEDISVERWVESCSQKAVTRMGCKAAKISMKIFCAESVN